LLKCENVRDAFRRPVYFWFISVRKSKCLSRGGKSIPGQCSYRPTGSGSMTTSWAAEWRRVSGSLVASAQKSRDSTDNIPLWTTGCRLLLERPHKYFTVFKERQRKLRIACDQAHAHTYIDSHTLAGATNAHIFDYFTQKAISVRARQYWLPIARRQTCASKQLVIFALRISVI